MAEAESEGRQPAWVLPSGILTFHLVPGHSPGQVLDAEPCCQPAAPLCMCFTASDLCHKTSCGPAACPLRQLVECTRSRIASACSTCAQECLRQWSQFHGPGTLLTLSIRSTSPGCNTARALRHAVERGRGDVWKGPGRLASARAPPCARPCNRQCHPGTAAPMQCMHGPHP